MILFVSRHYMRPDHYDESRRGLLEMNEMAAKAPGFVSHMTLIPDTEPYTLTTATIWETRADAEAWLNSPTHISGQDGKGGGGKEYADRNFFTKPPKQDWFEVIQRLP